MSVFCFFSYFNDDMENTQKKNDVDNSRHVEGNNSAKKKYKTCGAFRLSIKVTIGPE